MAKIYETVVIIDALIPDDSIDSEFEAIEQLIVSQGKLLKLDRWGKRKMAYQIKKKSHGEYAVFYYEAPPSLPSEMDKRFRINENILRWLTVADNPVGIPKDEPAPEAVAPDATNPETTSPEKEAVVAAKSGEEE